MGVSNTAIGCADREEQRGLGSACDDAQVRFRRWSIAISWIALLVPLVVAGWSSFASALGTRTAADGQ